MNNLKRLPPWISKKALLEEQKRWVDACYEFFEGTLPHDSNVKTWHFTYKDETAQYGPDSIK